MKDDPPAKGASVRARLANLAREKGVNLELYLVRYAHERLLFRLGQSKHRQRFILKGAMLQTVWLADPFRPTRDLDLLGHGDDDAAAVEAVFQDILSLGSDDGIAFVTLHTLRHSFASAAAELGYSELTIAGLLGHSLSGITALRTYA